MRICHITSVHDLRVDARILPKMAVSAAAAGNEVVVIAPERERPPLNGSKNLRLQTLDLPEERLRRWRRLDKVIALAAAQGADIYHLHDPELLPFASRLRRAAGSGRVVMDFHELMWADLLDKDYLPRIIRHLTSRLWPVLEKQWLKAIDGIVLAEDSYLPFYAHHGIPINVSRNFPLLPARLQRAPAAPRPGERLEMVYVGAIMPTRAILEMIETATVVARGWSGGAHLHVYGPLERNSYSRGLRQAADPRVVTLHGILLQERLAETLQGMNVSFALFYDRPGSYDSLPTKILESMLAGVPVVASDRPIIRKYLSPPAGGLVVNSLKPNVIADAVLAIANSPRFYHPLSKMAQRVRTHFTWQQENERLLSFYQQLLVGKETASYTRNGLKRKSCAVSAASSIEIQAE